MIKVEDFAEVLEENKINFFCGVPDSLLKDFCAYLSNNYSNQEHIITANEGNAIGLAAGYHLSTGKIGAVYMQNSGLGNAVNPLTSLTDKEVYSIPILLIIGWRGEPGVKDEPQHLKQGKITLEQLKVLGIPHQIISENINVKEVIRQAVNYMQENSAPYALVVRKNVFEGFKLDEKEKKFELTREEAMKLVLNELNDEFIISTTGKISRELFEFRKKHDKDFLTVGSMGHASSIALGISLNTKKDVYCFDGDGALLMHLGCLGVIGKLKPNNFKHIIFNNLAHDSVGGQETAVEIMNIPEIAKQSGYRFVTSATSSKDISKRVQEMKNLEGPVLLEIKINKGARNNLGRPDVSPIENKKSFMMYINKNQ